MTTTTARPAAFAGARAHVDLPHSCGGCDSRWSGANTAHCGRGGCHRTFTAVGHFDRHRNGGTCNDPAALGLVPMPGRAYEAWGSVGDDTPERAPFTGDEARALIVAGVERTAVGTIRPTGGVL